MRGELFTLPCLFKRETPNAVLVLDENTGEEIWFPISQVDSMHRDNDERGQIIVSAWIAKQKGLI